MPVPGSSGLSIAHSLASVEMQTNSTAGQTQQVAPLRNADGSTSNSSRTLLSTFNPMPVPGSSGLSIANLLASVEMQTNSTAGQTQQVAPLRNADGSTSNSSQTIESFIVPVRAPSAALANRVSFPKAAERTGAVASKPAAETPAETSSSAQTPETAPTPPGNSTLAGVPTNGDLVTPPALALKETILRLPDSGVAPRLTQPAPNSFNRPLPPAGLDGLFLEIWDDEQLLFPNTIPQVDDVLFPDAVLPPDDMPSPGAMPAGADGGADTAAEPPSSALPIARDSLPAVEPSEERAGNSWDARDDSRPENADGMRPFSPLLDLMPYLVGLAAAPDWMRDQVKEARVIWERRFKLKLTPERASPPK
jgi:hypothetical protein